MNSLSSSATNPRVGATELASPPLPGTAPDAVEFETPADEVDVILKAVTQHSSRTESSASLAKVSIEGKLPSIEAGSSSGFDMSVSGPVFDNERGTDIPVASDESEQSAGTRESSYKQGSSGSSLLVMSSESFVADQLNQSSHEEMTSTIDEISNIHLN